RGSAAHRERTRRAGRLARAHARQPYSRPHSSTPLAALLGGLDQFDLKGVPVAAMLRLVVLDSEAVGKISDASQEQQRLASLDAEQPRVCRRGADGLERALAVLDVQTELG